MCRPPIKLLLSISWEQLLLSSGGCGRTVSPFPGAHSTSVLFLFTSRGAEETFSPLFHSWFCIDHLTQAGVCLVNLLRRRKFGWSSSRRGEIKGIHDSVCGDSFSLLSLITGLWICSSSRSHRGSFSLFPLSDYVSHSRPGAVCMCVTLMDLWSA